MRFSLRELVFATIAAGAVVGMITNNYWMELECVRTRQLTRMQVVDEYDARRVMDRKTIDDYSAENAKLKARLGNFEVLYHKTGDTMMKGFKTQFNYIVPNIWVDTGSPRRLLYGKLDPELP